jgi:predicted extracellular nuclease
MKIKLNFLNLLIALAVTAGLLGMISSEVAANDTAQPLPFSQNWSDTGLISTNDDWSGVLGIMGYRGDDLTSTTGTDPQTILQPDDPGVVDVNANQTNPNTFTTGGVTEFELTDPVVALAGSGTADAPYLLILINTTGMTTIQVSYDLRDLETGSDDAIQQVALHYRVGNSGNFTNIPEAYVADATIGNDVKTTHVSVTLPSACDNAALVQLRIMTTNAVGNDEWVGIDNISISEGVTETAPTVVSTVPANGGTLAKDGNIVITFSEPVIVTEGWFDITCTDSGTHTAAVTDADPVYTLNPHTDFTGGESCTVTVYAAKVTDDDTEDPPDYMEGDYTFTFNVAYACGDPYTAIPDIQGDGMESPLSGQTVSTEGIVVADYQTNEYVSGTRNGFFMQSVTPDDDPDTSEGLFVYSYMLDVAVGDHVRVTGTATEYSGLTELSPVSQILVCSTGISVTPTEFALPATALLDFERFEGMLVTIPQELVISEYFNFDRYGEIVLTTERFMTFTAVNEPSVDGFAAWQDALKLNSITLDDGRESQNPDPAIHPNGEEFTLENRFRGGDLVSAVTGVMDYEFSKYRIQPTQGANYTEANPRPETLELAPGFLKVASFNVLNYFTTIDMGTGHWICGPSGDMECRGADTAEELTRQRAKILAALSGIDADIFGIMEIENDRPLGEGESPDYAVADLVAGLNGTYGEGTFAYIATGAIGTDAIKQAIIYKPDEVTPVGDFQLLTTAVDPRFIDTLNRPVLAQVFEDNFTGETFVVAVNHLKSKGSACTGDPDLLDGQGNCNLTRKNAALALVDWLANPEYFPDMENALIIGDLNSYDHEDPIDMIKLGADDAAGTDDDYFDMMAEFRGEDAYGYVYDGQIGYLDYALANASLAERIVDVNFWHINADEPDLIDYDMTFKQDAQDELYAPDAYRSSDHDPVVISMINLKV